VKPREKEILCQSREYFIVPKDSGRFKPNNLSILR